MDNQHQKITGYRDLNQDEIDLVNEVKALEDQAARLIDRLALRRQTNQRWLNTGRTDLQKGLMAVTRAVTTPASRLDP